MRISWAKCKRLLATLWFTGSGVIFFIVSFQTILGRYGENANEAWGWLLPTVMPTLSLIIGVMVMDALGRGTKIKTVDRFIFTLAFGLSVVYLLMVVLMILMQPFSSLSPLELMKQSNLWLGPFQGLVSALLGAFFIRVEKEKE